MKSLLYLVSHTTIQLRFVSMLSNSIVLLLGILMGFCSCPAFFIGAASGFLLGVNPVIPGVVGGILALTLVPYAWYRMVKYPDPPLPPREAHV